MRHKLAINLLPEMCDKYVPQTCRQLCINKNCLSLKCQRFAGNMLQIVFWENSELRLRIIVFAKKVLNIIFIVSISNFLKQLIVREKRIKKKLYKQFFSVLSPKPSIYYQWNVLCPLTNNVAPWSHLTMEIEHSV